MPPSKASRKTGLTVLVIAISLCGCTSESAPYAVPDTPRRFDSQSVHFPDRTPYDREPTLRAVYQNYYWFGYADGLLMRGTTFCDNSHPWYEIQTRGYYDGQRDAGRKLRSDVTRTNQPTH
jgi:hypothetical protein